MKVFRALGLLGLATVAASSQAAPISFTFDASVQGWTKGNFGNSFDGIEPDVAGAANYDAVLQAIRGDDHSGFAMLFSPNLGGGHSDLVGGALDFDFQASTSDATVYPFAVLVSGSAYLVKELQVPATSGLVPYSFALDTSAGWYFGPSPYSIGGSATLATQTQIDAVVSDLRFIGISTDEATGSDNTLLDNVKVGAVPEPASMAALALGGLGLLRRRKR